jgi:hypothetical protein
MSDDLGGAGFTEIRASESDVARTRRLTDEARVMLEGREARARAEAWARSVPGTPYGVTEAVLVVHNKNATPAPLDQRVLARMNSNGGNK